MQVSEVSQNFNFSFRFDNAHNKKVTKNDFLSDTESYKLSLSVDYKESAITYSVKKNESNNSIKQIDNSDKTKDFAAVKAEIKREIKEQTIQLLTQYLDEAPEAKNNLKEFFLNNPEALEKIEAGDIPDYFNVDNTAKRILDIYFSRYDDGDKEEFVKNAREIISQAYGEVGQMVGALPDIVLQTRDKIYEILDKFANEEDVSDFIKLGNPEN